jgi:Protein of unknown function (DUF2750)
MAKKISPVEIERVYCLSADLRYEYFCKKVIETDAIWYARAEGAALFVPTTLGTEALPVWPSKDFARQSVESRWVDAQYVELPLETWISEKLPSFINNSLSVVVLLDKLGTGKLVSPSSLLSDLQLLLGDLLVNRISDKAHSGGSKLKGWKQLQREVSRSGPRGKIPG